MAAHSFYCGIQDTDQTAGAYTNGTANNFCYWSNEGGAYNLGNITINAPTVSTIPGSTVSSNTANGAFCGTGIVNQDGGSARNTIGNGPASLANNGNGWSNPIFNIGALNIEDFATNYGNDYAGQFNAEIGPCQDVSGVSQTRPGNQETNPERYNILMPSGVKQGESAATKTGRRVVYRCASGALATTLAKVMPSPGKGFPATTFGSITTSQNDIQAAVVWLAFGYGVLLGDEPFCWTV